MVAAGHHCSVLVVEDEPELRELLRVALEGEGYRVALAGTGPEALGHLRSTAHTCMILLVLEPPAMYGRAFRAAQLRDRWLAWIPAVVVSGGSDASRDARDLGAPSFVRKPVDVDELRTALRRVGCWLAWPRPDQRAHREHSLRQTPYSAPLASA